LPEPPLPPPLVRADAVLYEMLALAVPPDSADARTLKLVNPATLTCHVPVLVVDVTAVAEFGGVTLIEAYVTPSPATSNCNVPVNDPVMVTTVPPDPGPRLATTQFVLTEQSLPAVLIVPVSAKTFTAINKKMAASVARKDFMVVPLSTP
jgi:hypothetical protein